MLHDVLYTATDLPDLLQSKLKSQKIHNGTRQEDCDSDEDASVVISHLKDKDLECKDYILIVEHNPDVRIQISRHLTNHFKVNYASTGKKAISILKKRKINLIVLDSTLPEMDALEFCRFIKTQDESEYIPVIFLMRTASSEHLIAAFESGIDSYLYKPINGEVLLIQIKSILIQRKKLYERISNKIYLRNKTEVKSFDHYFMRKVKTFIELNISNENLTMEKLAEGLMISRSQLHRKIKSISGGTTTDFVNLIRIRKAVELITTEKCYYNEVAFRVGFSSQSYFTKCFKKVYNVTPKEYFS